jgi:hypothetical protein
MGPARPHAITLERDGAVSRIARSRALASSRLLRALSSCASSVLEISAKCYEFFTKNRSPKIFLRFEL